jgi:CRP-like cAMP-binding protein
MTAWASGAVPDEVRDRLVERFGRRFLPGDALFRQGDPAREALLLQEGRVRLLRRVRAVDRSVVVLKPGDIVGEAALVEEGIRRSTAIALTEGLALAVDAEAFRAVLLDAPLLAATVLEQLVRRVSDAEDQIETLMLRGTQSKIVSVLLKLARPSATGAGAAELTVSPVELSSRVGLDVETVRRAVARLREQQYVRIVAERIEIPDLESLRRLSTLLGTKDELRGGDGTAREAT